MKKILLILPLILLVGCTNNVEEEKIAYLDYKNNLEEQSTFSSEETLVFNTYFNIEREEEKVNYSIVIDNPKINMYNIKALIIHDYLTEEAFPSVGIFDEAPSLLKDNDNKIELRGAIYSNEDINNVNFKLYIEYTDDDNLLNKVYYEVQRG